jgi:hypothetical protein
MDLDGVCVVQGRGECQSRSWSNTTRYWTKTSTPQAPGPCTTLRAGRFSPLGASTALADTPGIGLAPLLPGGENRLRADPVQVHNSL